MASRWVDRLWKMLEEPTEASHEGIVSWTEDGAGFSVYSLHHFTGILQTYFDTGSWGSFLRSLNLYNFKRSMVATTGVFCTYRHPMFRRDQPELRSGITRSRTKSAVVLSQGAPSSPSELDDASAGSPRIDCTSQQGSHPMPKHTPRGPASSEFGGDSLPVLSPLSHAMASCIAAAAPTAFQAEKTGSPRAGKAVRKGRAKCASAGASPRASPLSHTSQVSSNSSGHASLLTHASHQSFASFGSYATGSFQAYQTGAGSFEEKPPSARKRARIGTSAEGGMGDPGHFPLQQVQQQQSFGYTESPCLAHSSEYGMPAYHQAQGQFMQQGYGYGQGAGYGYPPYGFGHIYGVTALGPGHVVSQLHPHDHAQANAVQMGHSMHGGPPLQAHPSHSHALHVHVHSAYGRSAEGKGRGGPHSLPGAVHTNGTGVDAGSDLSVGPKSVHTHSDGPGSSGEGQEPQTEAVAEGIPVEALEHMLWAAQAEAEAMAGNRAPLA